jgi:hypothetical protein
MITRMKRKKENVSRQDNLCAESMLRCIRMYTPYEGFVEVVLFLNRSHQAQKKQNMEKLIL